MHVFCKGDITNMDTSCNLPVRCNRVIDLLKSLFCADTQRVSVEGDLGSSRIWAGPGLLLLWQDSCCLGRDCRRVQWQAERTEPLGSYNGHVCKCTSTIGLDPEDFHFYNWTGQRLSISRSFWLNFICNQTFRFVLFLDQENHAGGQSHFSDWCEVCPQTHGPDAGHLLGRRRGEDLRGSGRDEPESVVSAARDLLQAQLQLHLLEPFKVSQLNDLKVASVLKTAWHSGIRLTFALLCHPALVPIHRCLRWEVMTVMWPTVGKYRSTNTMKTQGRRCSRAVKCAINL